MNGEFEIKSAKQKSQCFHTGIFKKIIYRLKIISEAWPDW